MAVAVKTSPGARPAGLPGGVALISLVGIVYLVASLAIVFKLVPMLWWSAWESVGLARYTFVGGTLLALLALAVGVGLLWLGARLLGPNPPVGVRAGVFVGFFGLLLVLLLARWASLWYEYYAYTQGSLSVTTGAVLAGLTAGLLLAVWLRLFTRPWMQRSLVRLEEAGWFHASWYKANQGRLVRRGTIVGILLLAGAGIWSMMSGGTLRRGSPDWKLNIPFTGSVSVDSLGDATQFVAELPAERKTRVQVKWPGASGLKADDIVSVEQYQEKVKAILSDPNRDVPPAVKQGLEDAAAKGETVNYLLAVNRAIHARIEQLLKGTLFHSDRRKRIETVDAQTGWTDISKLLAAVRSEAEAEKKTRETGWLLDLPTAVPVVDRYALQEANRQADPSRHVRIGLNRNPDFFKGAENRIVSTEAFNREEVRVYSRITAGVLGDGEAAKKVLRDLEESSDGAAFKTRLNDLIDSTGNQQLRTRLEDVRGRVNRESIPERLSLTPATGTPQFATITLLPSLQFTVPLLLLAASIWLAWRVVNMPVFADFLIATEAELNKVSWTTQKRLVQDTIVVLVTVIVMSLFLFGTDWFWKTVLSSKPIGVLHIPEDKGEKQKTEDKKW